uniref:Uncharacterized protein n=1 Tax=Ciona savignyi TaxID=51511 RepID=H2YAI5_CIOSA
NIEAFYIVILRSILFCAIFDFRELFVTFGVLRGRFSAVEVKVSRSITLTVTLDDLGGVLNTISLSSLSMSISLVTSSVESAV